MRSLIAFIVTWSFLILTITGIVLYIVPQGRVAYWVDWSLVGLRKEQWGNIHMMFGGVFIVTGVLHLYFNWKPFKKYLAERVSGHLQIKQELMVSLGISLLILGGAILEVPPISWVFDLNETVKSAWVTSPELEPPFGHAEEVSLKVLSRRMNLDLKKAQVALQTKGIRFTGPKDSLKKIAAKNQTTPMFIYGLINKYQTKIAKADTDRSYSPERVEEVYVGTGVGRKTLEQMCKIAVLDVKIAHERLTRVGIEATDGEKMKEIAERYGVNPIDILKVILVDGFEL